MKPISASPCSVDLLLGGGLPHREGDARVELAKVAQRLQQRGIGGDVDEGQGQVALHALGHAARLGDALLQRLHSSARGLKEGCPRRCQRDAARGALEQRGSDGALQLADGLAQRRLRHVQPLGGAIEVQLLGHGNELLEQAGLYH
ncbi:hypothetical protein [Stenotrophomonas sp. HMSC10F06]|uniref:hypothetical protein n=1 Tax=Stenotrophomonas sp. HMSC10F06 TaxID=1581081 RepID=UPI0020C78CFA|nr:hypothetical protein [Stenotrophomonas sp. HMSC10F06]